MIRKTLLKLTLSAIIFAAASNASAKEPDILGLENTIKPFFNKYCIECHGPDAQKAGFRVDKLTPATTNLMAEKWQHVADQVGLGDMPPLDYAEQPTFDELDAVDAWIQAELARAETELAAGGVTEAVLRRLTPLEYKLTLRDLFKIDLREFDPTFFLAPEVMGDGFTTDGSKLSLTPSMLRSYIDAAAATLEHVVTLGDRPELFSKTWVGSQQLLPKAEINPDKPGMVYMEHWFDRGHISPREFTAHEDGLYRIRVRAHAVPPPMHRPGPKRWPVELSIRRHRPSEPRLPVDEIFKVYEGTEEFTAEHFMKKGDRIHTLFFNGWELGPGHIKQWRERGWHPHLYIENVAIEGPIIEEWPLPRHKTIFANLSSDVEDVDRQTAQQLLKQFTQRAFRRPVTESEMTPFYDLYDLGRSQNMDFYEGMKVALQGVLASPGFLFLNEPAGEMSHYAIASRLSYFLWSSMPDDELFRLATAGKLKDRETLIAQANRMLEDPKADSFYNRFADEWLNIDHVGVMTPDARLYPEYNGDLRVAMQEETRLFVRKLLKENLPLENIVDSDFTFLNEALAELYNIEGIEGEHMREVALPEDSRRGGIITQASVLNVTANGTITSPVVRGIYILENILGTHPPAAPPDVPLIEPDIRGATTVRAQLEKHREIPSCASCHAKIDPVGFAFENYDVLGGWRDNYRAVNPEKKRKRDPSFISGPSIDSADTMDGIGSFDGIDEFRALLLKPQQIAKIEENFARKLLTFAAGRKIRFSDENDLFAAIDRYRGNNPGARTMLHQIITSDTFLNQ
ncbi:MAG: DUF1592 domain-containing protein [Opitutales bacterium]|nr:DUF1592 domain-containing protein [Opitutales bacterium]